MTLPVGPRAAPPRANATDERHRTDPRAAQRRSRGDEHRVSRRQAESDEQPLQDRRPRQLDLVAHRAPHRVEVRQRRHPEESRGQRHSARRHTRRCMAAHGIGDSGLALGARDDVLLDRERHEAVGLSEHPGPQVAGSHVTSAHDRGPSSRLARRCALARWARVLTVFWGMPSRRAASRVVRPSSTVAWMTARISGERAAMARPRSPYSTPWSSSSSTVGEAAPGGRRVAQQHDVAARAQAADEPPDRDAPHPGADLAPPLVAPGALPHRDEGVLQHVGDDLAVVAAAAEPHRQPRRVPVVELPQRAEVAIGQSLEEGLVVGDDEG